MSVVVYLLLAGVAGWVAGRWLGGGVPYAPVGATLGGVVGAVLLALPFGDQGPALLAVAVIPATLGALGGAMAAALLIDRAARRVPVSSSD